MHAITHLSADLTARVTHGLTDLHGEVVKLATDLDTPDEVRRGRLAELQRDVGALLNVVSLAEAEVMPAPPSACASESSVDTLERALGQLASYHFGAGGALVPFLQARGHHELAECIRKADQ